MTIIQAMVTRITTFFTAAFLRLFFEGSLLILNDISAFLLSIRLIVLVIIRQWLI